MGTQDNGSNADSIADLLGGEVVGAPTAVSQTLTASGTPANDNDVLKLVAEPAVPLTTSEPQTSKLVESQD